MGCFCLFNAAATYSIAYGVLGFGVQGLAFCVILECFVYGGRCLGIPRIWLDYIVGALGCLHLNFAPLWLHIYSCVLPLFVL